MDSETMRCSNPDCDLASERKCVEGLIIEQCPHVEKISIDDIPEVEELEVEVPHPELTISLTSGEPLDRDNASSLQRWRISRSIGLIGPNDSGKTSLIAGIYDLLQDGPVAGVQFAGSSTLIGFEKMCHLARAVSRRIIPHTERTSRGADAAFFHLDLYKDDVGLVSLFIGDRSGEDYLSAMDQISLADQFFEVRRADCVTLLVDGAQLVDPGFRHEVKSATPQIIDALIEGRAIRAGCRLAIVLTKKDSVTLSPHVARAEKDFEGLVRTIVENHGTYLGEVGSFSVAASPKDCERVRRGEGLGELLLFWLKLSPLAAVPCDELPPVFERMIDRLMDKEMEK